MEPGLNSDPIFVIIDLLQIFSGFFLACSRLHTHADLLETIMLIALNLGASKGARSEFRCNIRDQ